MLFSSLLRTPVWFISFDKFKQSQLYKNNSEINTRYHIQTRIILKNVAWNKKNSLGVYLGFRISNNISTTKILFYNTRIRTLFHFYQDNWSFSSFKNEVVCDVIQNKRYTKLQRKHSLVMFTMQTFGFLDKNKYVYFSNLRRKCLYY